MDHVCVCHPRLICSAVTTRRHRYARPNKRRKIINTHIYYYAQLLLAPVLIIGVTGFARASQRRAIVTLAMAAMLVLLVGVVFFDVVTGFHSLTSYVITRGAYVASDIVTVEFSFVVISAGSALASAASVIALSQAARLSRWGWFAALAFMLLFAEAVFLLFSQGFPLADLKPDLYTQFETGNATFSVVFFTVLSVVIVLTPLVSLFYGLRGPGEPEVAPQPPKA